MKKLLLLLTFFLISGIANTARAQSYVDYYRQGMQALEEDSLSRFLLSMQKADSLRPNHPVILYQLAKAYMLKEQPKAAINTLNYRMRFYAASDFLEDSAFETLRKEPGWSELTGRLASYTKPKQNSSTAFSFGFEDFFHPEGIAYQNQKDRFLISDVRNGLIYSFGSDGSERKLVIDLTAHGYWSAMGMAFDPNDPKKLWIATAALPNYSKYGEELKGKSAVLRIDLETSSVEQSFSTEGEHLFGDLIVGVDGTVFVSDSYQPVIYTIQSEGHSMEEFLRHGTWWNLQGLALSGDGQVLYVADYITGIHRIDLKTKSVEPLIEENERLRGADGIYQNQGRLFLLQNGTEPKRISSIRLDTQGYGMPESLTVIDQALPELNEPTLGTWVGNQLHFIANSPWPHYDEQQNPVAESWPIFKVFKLDTDR